MNYTIRLGSYEFEVKELLLLFFTFFLMENIFSWLVLPVSNIILMYEKLLSIALFAVIIYNFQKLKRSEQIYLGLMGVFMVRMVFESMINYGSIFQQLTLFTILFPVAYIVFVKWICRTYDFDILELIAYFYISLYIVFMLIYGRGFSFSLELVQMDDYGPFSGDSRIIHARSIFMMIVPLLWFLNEFISKGKRSALIPFIFCLTVIIMHQHRSVWASALFALGVYFLVSFRNNLIPGSRALRTFLVAIIATALLLFIVSQVFPGALEFFGDRFSEILDPAKEDGTGKFRADQRRVYFPMAMERPFFGWTFDGFEMKNPLVDWWPEKSGQHFHEGFMEMLFYHGFFGLILKYFYVLYLGYKAFSRNLNPKAIILIAFSLSGLLFSLSYVLPLIYWGMVGISLYYLEREEDIIEEIEDADYEEIEEEESRELTVRI
ncbi:MAG: O-antigen ligase family protein [Pedobacter sp.]